MEFSANVLGSNFYFHESKSSVKVGGSRFTCMEILMEVDGRTITSMEFSGSFHENAYLVEVSTVGGLSLIHI